MYMYMYTVTVYITKHMRARSKFLVHWGDRGVEVTREYSR